MFGDMLEFAVNHKTSGNNHFNPTLWCQNQKEKGLKISKYLKSPLLVVAIIYVLGGLLYNLETNNQKTSNSTL